MNIIWLAFLTGLTTGGISCLAVQGGLLATAITGESNTRFKQVAMFIGAKLVSYTILGLFLGYIGSTLTLAPRVMGFVQIGVGLFMVATALRFLNVHPIFRYAVITPPRWAFRLLKNTSRSQSYFAPGLLGFFTVLMPCGVTQATMAVAVASGSAPMGAAIMFAFVLGTSPIFFALGGAMVQLMQKKVFTYLAAGIIGIFAILSINGGVALTGSPYTLQNFYQAAVTPLDKLAVGGLEAKVAGGFQEVTIDVASSGYTSNASTLKKGIPVRLTLKTNNTNGCSRAFTIPALGISKVLPVTGTEVVEFTPKKTGSLAYTCSMGMYTGEFEIL